MAYRIALDPCINCGWCRRACPTECIHYFVTGRRTHVIEPSACIDCGICARVCPVDCISIDALYEHNPAELAAAKQKAKAWARRRHEREQRLNENARALVAMVGRVP